MKVRLNPNEVVLKAGHTNQVINKRLVEGKLLVTNQRIYFKTIAEEPDRYNIEILFGNIMDVIFYRKGLFLAKGLNIITRDGKNYVFPLRKRDEIGQLINKMH